MTFEVGVEVTRFLSPRINFSVVKGCTATALALEGDEDGLF